MFTEKDLQQIGSMGIAEATVNEQIQRFKNGFPPIKLIAAATPGNGIKVLSEGDEERMVEVFENALASGLNALKFIPASGAASRMFKNLFSFLENAKTKEEADELANKDDFMQQFFSNIEKFAFFETLKQIINDPSDKREWVEKLLSEDGLGYGVKPKGQIEFHKYNNHSRTAFEEHLFEAVSCCTSSKGMARLHFTVSPDHQKGFEDILLRAKAEYQKRLGIQFEVEFSHQKQSTDTIAVDMNNEPFRNDDDTLLFRPGGHGALIENLSDLDADVIFIKNIDNVVPDNIKAQTQKYKKALGGLLITHRDKVFGYLEKLDKPESENNEELLLRIEAYIKKELCISSNTEFNSNHDRVEFLKAKLNRPLRICGMVKNEGEPGGGPFITTNQDGTSSPQVVESAQINMSDAQQLELLNQSTHFNPVDLICCIKNNKGQKFDLVQYRDNDTGFISFKSNDGKDLKAQELPGLWNGAMSDWNTIFVEVPIITFNPVKTINDLLRPEHQ